MEKRRESSFSSYRDGGEYANEAGASSTCPIRKTEWKQKSTAQWCIVIESLSRLALGSTPGNYFISLIPVRARSRNVLGSRFFLSFRPSPPKQQKIPNLHTIYRIYIYIYQKMLETRKRPGVTRAARCPAAVPSECLQDEPPSRH